MDDLKTPDDEESMRNKLESKGIKTMSIEELKEFEEIYKNREFGDMIDEISSYIIPVKPLFFIENGIETDPEKITDALLEKYNENPKILKAYGYNAIDEIFDLMKLCMGFMCHYDANGPDFEQLEIYAKKYRKMLQGL